MTVQFKNKQGHLRHGFMHYLTIGDYLKDTKIDFMRSVQEILAYVRHTLPKYNISEKVAASQILCDLRNNNKIKKRLNPEYRYHSLMRAIKKPFVDPG